MRASGLSKASDKRSEAISSAISPAIARKQRHKKCMLNGFIINNLIIHVDEPAELAFSVPKNFSSQNFLLRVKWKKNFNKCFESPSVELWIRRDGVEVRLLLKWKSFNLSFACVKSKQKSFMQYALSRTLSSSPAQHRVLLFKHLCERRAWDELCLWPFRKCYISIKKPFRKFCEA